MGGAGGSGHFMRADPTINLHLNVVLKTALVTINQYFLHARMLGSWGLQNLELQEYQAAIRSTKHADKVMSRILSLNGAPVGLNVRDLGKLLVGENVSGLLKNDLTMESLYRDALITAMKYCEERNDPVSRRNLASLLAESEHRIEWLRGQLGLIDKMGAQGYLESSSFVPDSSSQPAEATEQAESEVLNQPTEPTVQAPSKATGADRDLPSDRHGHCGRAASKTGRIDPDARSDAAAPSGRTRADPGLPRFAADPGEQGAEESGGVDRDSVDQMLASYFLR